MNVLVLILTNAASFIGGAFACWWLTVHAIDKVKEAQVDDDKSTTGSGLTWLVIGLVIIGLAVVGLVSQLQHKQTSDCLREYVSGSAPLSADRDAATQKLWDDFASFQHIGPKEADKIAALRQTFFEDLAAEKAADDALQAYRESHAADEVCGL